MISVYMAAAMARLFGERDEEGASIIEYALLVGLIAVVCVLAITVVGREVSQSYSHIGSGL